jgi:hypothetical protein
LRDLLPRGASALGAALLLAACAKVDSGPHEWQYDGPVNSCGGDGDCALGGCDTDLGACVVDPPYGETLFARVVPDPDTGASPQVYSIAVGAGEIPTPFEVRVPVTVVGETLVVTEVVEGEAATAALAGRVVFSDVGNRLPGQEAQITVYEAEGGGVFDLSLLPSMYDVTIVPDADLADADGSAYPMYYLDGVALDATGVFQDAEGHVVDVVVPRAAARLKGQVAQGTAPVNGLEVVAFDPASGRLVSTADETRYDEGEGKNGTFEIGLSESLVASGGTFSLRVTRPNEAHHPVFVAGDFTPPAAGETLDLEDDPRIAFGALGTPVRFQATVLQPVVTESGTELYDTAPSCFVAFTSADVAGGSVEKWVLTNESGELEETPGLPGVNLYKGDYEVTVIPAYAPLGSTSDYSVYASDEPIEIDADNVAGEVELRLGWRPVVTGMVAAGDRDVPASAIAARPAVGAASTARPNSAISGATGSFRIWLDAAPYIVVAEAPAESRYAWSVLAATVPDEEALALSFELPLPFAIRGAVAPSSEQVSPIDVSGSVIEWYREIDGRAYVVGRSVAGEDGGFAALLPP